MSDTLLGVIIGGAIAIVGPIMTLAFNHIHWKREAKLAHLKSERVRLEKLFDENLKRFSEAVQKNSYPSDMTADITVFMPKDVSERYFNFILDKNKTEQKRKEAYLEIALEMKRALADIDKQIADLVS